MNRGRRRERRKLSDADSSDEDMNVESRASVIDPKIALSKADLGNAARDRQTAHDPGRDRQVDFGQINAGRKCNRQGTVEAENATKNQSQISGWNNFGGTDAATNLDDIAHGQYHRLATTRKVQAEISQLHELGKDINAELVDRVRHLSAQSHVRGAGAQRSERSRIGNSHPLDSARITGGAVDSGRKNQHKIGKQRSDERAKQAHGESSRRRGRGSRGGRGGHRGRPGRKQSTSVPTGLDPALQQDTNRSMTSAGKGKGLAAGVAMQRRRQERPWPPSALMVNPEPMTPASVDAGTAAAQTLSQDSDQEEEIWPIPQIPSISAAESLILAEQLESVWPSRSNAKSTIALPGRQSLSAAQLSSHTTKLADTFSDWMQIAAATTSDSFDRSLAVHDPSPSLPVRAGSAQALTISRDELRAGRRRCPAVSNERNTDGRLTPVEFSDLDDSDSTAPSDSAVGVNVHGQRGRDTVDARIPSLDNRSRGIRSGHEDATRNEQIAPSQDGGDSQDQGQASKVSASDSRPFSSKNVTNYDKHGVSLEEQRSNVVFAKDDFKESKGSHTPLTRRPGNVPVASSSKETISAAPSKEKEPEPSDRGNVHAKGNQNVVGGTTLVGSTLGDWNNFQRHASAKNSTHDLFASRYASEEPRNLSKPQQTRSKHAQPGPGYDELVRRLQENNLSVKNDGRPKKLAFAPPPGSSGLTFKQPRKSDESAESDSEL